jgi:hypothetical protein
MTTEEQQQGAALEAGRELDRMVAERVFGHEVKLVTEEERDGPEGWDLQDVERRYPWRSTLPSGEVVGGWASLRPYSSDIAAAFLVVERMQQDGWSFTLRDDGRTHGPAWEVDFVGVLHDGWAQADTAPLAIARAAIHALAAAEDRVR